MAGILGAPFACCLIFISSTIPPFLLLAGTDLIFVLGCFFAMGGLNVLLNFSCAANFLSSFLCSSLSSDSHWCDEGCRCLLLYILSVTYAWRVWHALVYLRQKSWSHPSQWTGPTRGSISLHPLTVHCRLIFSMVLAGYRYNLQFDFLCFWS